MRAIRTLLLTLPLVVLAACQTDTPEEVAPGVFDPNLVERQQALCETDGGRWGVGGKAGNFVCYRTTPDANRQCRSADDCEGLCLARSGTCAPVTPFFGCHEVLNAGGTRQTLCID